MLPHHAAELAKKHEISLPVSLSDGQYVYSGFEEFLSLYDQIGHVVRTGNDLSEVAYRYLDLVAASGTKYVEFMISPGHSIANGIPFASQISAISDSLDKAKAELNVSGNIVVTCVRHRGPEEAIEVAEMAARQNSRYIRGFGLTGNENIFDVGVFRAAFLVAEGAGLGLTAHVGEWSSARAVLEAVTVLNLSRVGHGISVADEPDIMMELVERRVGFEICLSSNVTLGASKSYAQHQARSMLNAGCAVSFSTDDPAYFNTTPKREVQLAIQHLKLTPIEQSNSLSDGIEMAFCSEVDKGALKAELLPT